MLHLPHPPEASFAHHVELAEVGLLLLGVLLLNDFLFEEHVVEEGEPAAGSVGGSGGLEGVAAGFGVLGFGALAGEGGLAGGVGASLPS